jgi:hypothetical protein
MSTPRRIQKPVRLNLTQRLRAAEAKIVENPTFHGEKIRGWWLITPMGNFKLRGRGGPDTNAAALEMLDLLDGGDPGTMPPSDRTGAPAAARKRPTTHYPPPTDS